MLLSNSRIEKNDKIHFYEKDILLDDHVYSGNIQVTIDVDYINSGIGIALVSDEGLSLTDDGETYLFRLGHSEYSIVRRYGSKIDVLENGPAVNIKPFKKNMKVQVKKIGNKVSFSINNVVLSTKYLPTSLGNYTVGIYSNAGNIINSTSIASEIPEGWVVNMKNTNGGYIKFSKSSFTLTNCLDKAEVEQVKIKLKANTPEEPSYTLLYETEEVDGKFDIVPYVFLSDDNRYKDKDKNILDKNKSFTLKNDKEINIKFTGTIGRIKNVQVSERADDFYVGTDYETKEITKSLIKIKLDEVKKIVWEGVIHGIPKYDISLPNASKFGVVRDSLKIYTPEEIGVLVGKEYRTSYNIEINKTGKVSKLNIKGNDGNRVVNLVLTDSLVIFENIDAIIDKLTIYKMDGTIVDLILETTKKQYVPGSIKSPIIVTDENGEPLELSSSYRVITTENNSEYVFTNVEREVFNPTNRIKLTNKPSQILDSIVVYCVPKESRLDLDKIYHNKKINIRDISEAVDSYKLINEADLYRVDKSTGVININEFDDYSISSKYQAIVVDYLKHNSYAINYKHELGSYEVDISTFDDTKLYYDGIVTDEDKGLVEVNEHKLINTVVKNNSYIVLRAGDE